MTDDLEKLQHASVDYNIGRIDQAQYRHRLTEAIKTMGEGDLEIISGILAEALED